MRQQIQYGCQTYPWKMNISAYAGKVPHIIQKTAEAGFQGLEAEICMLGDYFHKPEEVKALLEENHIDLAALVLHQPWEQAQETEEERQLSDEAIAFLSHFPFAKLMVSHHAGQTPRGDGEALLTRRKNLLSCMDSVACRAAERGIVTCYHPNSAKNSLFRTAEDYKVLFELMDRTRVGWAPDVGHIVNGGMDALTLLKEGRSRICHVHFKDRAADGAWAVMGKGDIDYPAIVRYLKESGYGGWIMVEDESPEAEQDSDGVVLRDGTYMKQFMEGGN